MGRCVTNSGQSGGKIKARVKTEKKADTACFNGRSNSTGDPQAFLEAITPE